MVLLSERHERKPGWEVASVKGTGILTGVHVGAHAWTLVVCRWFSGPVEACFG